MLKKAILYGVCISFLFSMSVTGVSTNAAAQFEIEAVKINGTTWNISVWGTGRKAKSRSTADTLIFSNGKFISKSFESQGYSPAGYTVRVEDDGTTIWEAMQMDEDGNRIFWRGDINPQTMKMRGMMCKQSRSGKTQDFNFVSD